MNANHILLLHPYATISPKYQLTITPNRTACVMFSDTSFFRTLTNTLKVSIL
jgi:hypothetical protein